MSEVSEIALQLKSVLTKVKPITSRPVSSAGAVVAMAVVAAVASSSRGPAWWLVVLPSRVWFWPALKPAVDGSDPLLASGRHARLTL